MSFLGRVAMGMSWGLGMSRGWLCPRGEYDGYVQAGGYSPSSSLDTWEFTNISILYHVQTLLPTIKYIPYGKYLLGWFHNRRKRHGSN